MDYGIDLNVSIFYYLFNFISILFYSVLIFSSIFLIIDVPKPFIPHEIRLLGPKDFSTFSIYKTLVNY